MNLERTIQKFCADLAMQGVDDDIVIYSESLFERVSDELLESPYRGIPLSIGRAPTQLEMYTSTGNITIRKDSPQTVQKLVHDELNRRAMYSMRYKR